MTLQIRSQDVVTRLGVPIDCVGVAQVKIESREPKVLAIAAENFLDKSDREVQQIALETMEGHQRSIMGKLTVEQIYKDRTAFGQQEMGFQHKCNTLATYKLHVIT